MKSLNKFLLVVLTTLNLFIGLITVNNQVVVDYYFALYFVSMFCFITMSINIGKIKRWHVITKRKLNKYAFILYYIVMYNAFVFLTVYKYNDVHSIILTLVSGSLCVIFTAIDCISLIIELFPQVFKFISQIPTCDNEKKK